MKYLLLPLLLLVPVAMPRAAAAAAAPNIVMVFIDDMGWGDLSCFGNTHARTPHIDRLAAEGIRYSQFYVNSPICSPSRVALSTGQYPQRWRITSFLNNRADNERRGMAQWLDPKAPMLARYLKQSGYATGHFGKWHMGGQRDVGEAPLISEYGFDESLTNFEGLGPRLLGLGYSHDGQPPRRSTYGSDKLGRGPIIWYDVAHITAGYTGAAILFIDKAAADGRPFYVNLWPGDVHSPFFPLAAKRGDGSKKALYHGVLETMDEQLGVLFEHIRNAPKLQDNTLILLCSDNGPEPGAGSAGSFRGVKGTLYEGGIRSPLIVWGPGFIPANKTGHHNETSFFAAFDLAPSLLRFAGAKAPAGVAFDGEDIVDTLLGKSDASRQAAICWRRPPDRKSMPAFGVPLQPDLAIREGDWKLLCEYDGSKPELYDLARDRAETTNVAAQYKDAVGRLTAKLLAWHRSMPPDNGPALGPVPTQGGKKKKVQENAGKELSYNNSEGILPNMADPFILQSGGKYYLYGTDGKDDVHLGFKVYESTNLVNWSAPVGVHSGGRALEKQNSWGTRGFWGAEVYERNGKFYMYYTVEEHLAIATSDSPLGPFVQPQKKPLRPQREIDPHLFVDEDGKAYMYYVSFENRSNDIYVVEMNDDWLTPKDDTKTRCIWHTQPWENADPKYARWPVTEGSAVLKHKGVYYLCYTGNHYLSQKYAVGYATASSPFGPWVKHEGNPILQGTKNLRGTGHCSFVRAPNRELIMVYHSHKDISTPNPRKLAIDRCEFVTNPDKSKADVLRVKGPTDTLQIVRWKSLGGS